MNSKNSMSSDIIKTPLAEDMAKERLQKERGKNIELWSGGEQTEYWIEIYSMGVNDERVRASGNIL